MRHMKLIIPFCAAISLSLLAMANPAPFKPGVVYWKPGLEKFVIKSGDTTVTASDIAQVYDGYHLCHATNDLWHQSFITFAEGGQQYVAAIARPTETEPMTFAIERIDVNKLKRIWADPSLSRKDSETEMRKLDAGFALIRPQNGAWIGPANIENLIQFIESSRFSRSETTESGVLRQRPVTFRELADTYDRCVSKLGLSDNSKFTKQTPKPPQTTTPQRQTEKAPVETDITNEEIRKARSLLKQFEAEGRDTTELKKLISKLAENQRKQRAVNAQLKSTDDEIRVVCGETNVALATIDGFSFAETYTTLERLKKSVTTCKDLGLYSPPASTTKLIKLCANLKENHGKLRDLGKPKSKEPSVIKKCKKVGVNL